MKARQSTSLYAAYGSNLHPRRLRERIRSATLRGTSFLHKYTLQFHKRGQDRSAKCGFSDCGQGMHVAVYEVDDADRKVLDVIEGAILKRRVLGRTDGVVVMAEGLTYLLGDLAELEILFGREVPTDAAGHPRLSEVDLARFVKAKLQAAKIKPGA